MSKKEKSGEFILPDKENEYTLSDLIDIDLLQKLQDSFANAMNVASLTLDNNGPVTKPSNFTDFCIKYTRKSLLGRKRCNQCDISWGKLAAKEMKPVVYGCHAGLTDFAVPIIVDGKHVGSIFGGQILSQKPDEKEFRKIAKELGINEDEYIAELKKVKIVPKKNVEAAAKLLFIVANAISEIGHKNLKLLQKDKIKNLYTYITETIRSTIDVDETKKKIVEIVGKAMQADRCFIGEYNKATNSYFEVKYEYLSSDAIKSYKGTNVNIDVPKFASLLKEGKNIIINNKKIYSDNDDNEFIMEKIAIEKNNVTSAFAFPLYYLNTYIGFLALHYVEKQKSIQEDEMELLEAIAGQISIAINRVNIYSELTQTTKNQNAILNNMPFMAWLKDKDSKLIAVNEAFAKMCNATVDSIVGKTDFDFFPKEHCKSYIEEDKRVMREKTTISSVDLISGTEGAKWHETFKSPVFDELGNVIGTVGLARDITAEKDSEVKLLKKQEQINVANEREKLIGKIISKAISTFDINGIKQIVKEVGLITKADRCYFVEVDLENMKGKPIEYDSEYRSSEDIKTITGYQFSTQDVDGFVNMYLKSKDLIVFDYEKIQENQAEENKGILRYSQLFGIKSGIGIPFIYMNKLIAVLAIEYMNQKVFPTEEELNFLRILCNQTGMAFNQIQLYHKAKLTAEREIILRKIIETIRSTVDINFIKHEMIYQIGTFLKADRVAFADYDTENRNYCTHEGNEYRSCPEVKSFIGYDFASIPGFAEAIRKVHTSGKDIIFDDLDKYLEEHNLINSDVDKFYKEMDFMSSIAINIYHGDIFYGNLVVTFSQKRKITDDDIRFVKTLANQAGIAIYQATLYEKEKLTAEREKINRNIVEILRSTLDRNTIKQLFVQNIGKIFNADRVLFSDYDAKNRVFLPVDKYSQYLSDTKEKSFIGYDWTQAPIKEHIRPLLEKRELNIPSFEEYISKYERMQEFISIFKDAKVKSSYNFPVLYQEEIMGYFGIEFTKEIRILSKEDLQRIRGICTQAGIALYHANLYIEAKNSSLSKGEFIANISQEIQTSLTKVINLGNEIIKTNMGSNWDKKYEQQIKECLNTVAELRKDIIQISKIEEENFKANYESINIEEIINQILNNQKIFTEEKSIQINKKINIQTIKSDGQIIYDMLNNIICIMIEMLPNKGEMNIITESQDSQTTIIIEETGASKEIEIQNKIFEKFKQIDSNFPIKRHGTGLKLSISKKLIEILKGTITVDSTEKMGTIIKITFPKM